MTDPISEIHTLIDSLSQIQRIDAACRHVAFSSTNTAFSFEVNCIWQGRKFTSFIGVSNRQHDEDTNRYTRVPLGSVAFLYNEFPSRSQEIDEVTSTEQPSKDIVAYMSAVQNPVTLFIGVTIDDAELEMKLGDGSSPKVRLNGYTVRDEEYPEITGLLRIFGFSV